LYVAERNVITASSRTAAGIGTRTTVTSAPLVSARTAADPESGPAPNGERALAARTEGALTRGEPTTGSTDVADTRADHASDECWNNGLCAEADDAAADNAEESARLRTRVRLTAAIDETHIASILPQ
jgi:hypothetical protein